MEAKKEVYKPGKHILQDGIMNGKSHAELAALMHCSHGTLSRLMIHFWQSNLTELRKRWKVKVKK